MRDSTAVALAIMVLAGSAAAAETAELPPNKWVVLHDGPPGIIASHAKLVWLPPLERAFLWPCYDYHSRHVSVDDHAKVFLYCPAADTWEAKATTYPTGMRTAARPDPSVAYLWMPGLRKILFLHDSGDGRGSKHAHSWLLDPRTWTWQPLVGELRMTDRSRAFNPCACSDGRDRPIWGALCYDAHNKQAVLIGGCGTWGRVGKRKEPLQVGDWLYDEAATPKRVRRLLAAEKGKIAAGRKWYPAQCGCWTFSEKTRTWTAIEQPLAEQPSGRILPAAVYDAKQQQLVLFGGDDFTAPLGDTWLYDCRTRRWRRAKPETSPPPRAAHAMVYLPDQDAVLLAGGYGPGWKMLRDCWVYRTHANTWTRLAADLPTGGYYFSATRDPQRKAAVVCTHPFRGAGWPKPWRGEKGRTIVMALKLDLDSAPTAPPKPVPADKRYHCQVDPQWGAPMPDQWRGPKNKGLEPEVGRKALAALPANTWVLRKPPMPSRARQWGSYAYDPRHHKAYAWGGGHHGYTGCEVSEYDVLRNRWTSMNDPVAYKVNWRRGSAGGIPGPSFQGWRLMGTHARKSYAVDYKSDSVITLHGDVYSIAEERFVTCIGRCPGRYGAGNQVCFENTPDGVYGFHGGDGGQLWLADVAAGRWRRVCKGGPKGHNEYATLCYDRKRNRLFYTVSPRKSGREYWSYDIAAGNWTQLQPANKCLGLAGCPTYVDDLDAILWTWGTGGRRGGKLAGRMTLYKIAENRFYTAPWRGPTFGSHGDLNNSPHYDAELKLIVRLAHLDRGGFIPVGVLRLDPKTLKLTESE